MKRTLFILLIMFSARTFGANIDFGQVNSSTYHIYQLSNSQVDMDYSNGIYADHSNYSHQNKATFRVNTNIINTQQPISVNHIGANRPEMVVHSSEGGFSSAPAIRRGGGWGFDPGTGGGTGGLDIEHTPIGNELWVMLTLIGIYLLGSIRRKKHKISI